MAAWLVSCFFSWLKKSLLNKPLYLNLFVKVIPSKKVTHLDESNEGWDGLNYRLDEIKPIAAKAMRKVISIGPSAIMATRPSLQRSFSSKDLKR
jgi:hypothetical protein